MIDIFGLYWLLLVQVRGILATFYSRETLLWNSKVFFEEFAPKIPVVQYVIV